MRLMVRRVLVVLLLVSAGFAGWAWLRPYAWGEDEAARCRVVGCQVRQDRSNYWLEVHLKVRDGKVHDLAKPVVLESTAGRRLEAADTTVQNDEGGGIRELWLKFWLDGGDFDGPLTLRINDGVLQVRSGAGEPALGARGMRYFTSNRW